MAAGSNVALGSCTLLNISPAVEPYRKYPELDALLLSLGLLDDKLAAAGDHEHEEDDEYADADDDDYYEYPGRKHSNMLRSFIIPSKALSSLSKQAIFVASARDLRDHFPTRHTVDPATYGLHTLVPSASRPSARDKTNRLLILPQNIRQNTLPSFLYGTPAPGPSYTNRATEPEPEEPPPPASTPESTIITDSEDSSTIKTFQYNISVSYVSKQKRWDPSNTFHFSPYKRMTFEENWSLRKKGRPKTGQDAFFVSRVSDTGAVAFGVADGVGGYSMSGIDSADFSHTLCEDMAEISYHSEVPMKADMLIEAGYLSACNNPNILGGGSTACVGIAKADGTMEAANLGDSGFVILRGGRVHHTSQPQTHAFNTPFQLSVIPPDVIEQARKFGGPIPISDRPRDAFSDIHELKHGDVIIFATDGLWDNISAQDVLRLVSNEMVAVGGWVENPESGIQAGQNLSVLVDEDADTPSIQGIIAKKIAAKAKDMSINTKIDGPFAKEVRRYFPGEVYHGGKRDDICVLCCVVVEYLIPAPRTLSETTTTESQTDQTSDSTSETPTEEKEQTPPAPPASEVPKKEDPVAALADRSNRGVLPGGGGPGAPTIARL
ncbi:hypothetical protein H072_5215 [Dactylellina haptotyla CBS 200.50]|uniref:Protein phosphatase n=1 Tax=Dactylellina haptotyla (strain CBS 200.50) TaxID=1284197 RepID=S8AD47_DACHA|nr:hypothetical protein H072_5215 [Dactylellina haptotyla CBS 200.50]